jgi:broad specificity phosphatase PhoE
LLLYLVRHGETDWNRQRRIQGSTDVPLNDTGRAQAKRAGELLANRRWDAVVASPLSRAFDTASIIATEVGLPEPTTDDRLVERAYGDAEGLEISEVDRRYPGETHVPGREGREDVAARALDALIEIAEAHPDQAVIVVTHGGLIRSVLHAVDPHTRHPAITNGSVHSFKHDNGTVSLIRFDDPVVRESQGPVTDSIEVQNRIEGREAANDQPAQEQR